MQLTLVQSETSLSWFYIGDRQAGQTNKSNLFHCLFVLWTSCGGPTHTEEKIHSGWTCNLGALLEDLVLVLGALPGGEGFIERLWGEKVPETDLHRNRVDIARLLLLTETDQLH